ncbi:MAG: DinB family protein [Saprospiraceae bacterium]|nr:DinB family protein [Saprospiraceae bacterium]
MIQTDLDLMRQTRRNFLQLVEACSLDQLNRIPDGYANNLVWNYGHIVVTLPLLTYGLSGLPLPVDAEIVALYRRGSRPDAPVDEEGWRQLQSLSEQTLQQVSQDYNAGLFREYKPYTTTYGYSLNNVDDAIRFAPVHEGLHYGYAMALIRQIR